MVSYSDSIGDYVYFTDDRTKEFDTIVKDNNGNKMKFGTMYHVKSEYNDFYFIPLKYRHFAYQSDDAIKGDVDCLVFENSKTTIRGQRIYYTTEIINDSELTILDKEILDKFDNNFLIKVFDLLGLEYKIVLK